MTVVVTIKNDCNAALGNTKAPIGDLRPGPCSLHWHLLACNEGSDNAPDDACAEFDPASAPDLRGDPTVPPCAIRTAGRGKK